MDKAEIKTLAEAVIAPFLKGSGFLGADVEEKPNSEGEDSLYITLHFSPGAVLAGGLSYIDAQVAMVDALADRGERRFPYFKYDYPDVPAPFDEYETISL